MSITTPARCGLVLAAAGSGSRFGSTVPKQFLEWRGKPLFMHSLLRFAAFVIESVVVVSKDRVESTERALAAEGLSAGIRVVAGGGTRQASVSLGLAALSDGIDIVLVHDAARPLVSDAVVNRVIAGALKEGACIPVLPVKDTVKEISEGFICATLNRDRLGLAQTPQGFRLDLLREASDQADREGFAATDEAMLVEHLGRRVLTVAGDPENLKVTWQDDLKTLGAN